jgi:hypothetical protein
MIFNNVFTLGGTDKKQVAPSDAVVLSVDNWLIHLLPDIVQGRVI